MVRKLWGSKVSAIEKSKRCTIEKILKKYDEQDLTYTRIAEKLGVTKCCVHLWFVKLGYPPRPVGRRKTKKKGK